MAHNVRDANQNFETLVRKIKTLPNFKSVFYILTKFWRNFKPQWNPKIWKKKKKKRILDDLNLECFGHIGFDLGNLGLI